MTIQYNIMTPGRTTCSANVATGSTLKAPESNESEKISSVESLHQIMGTQVEVPETVPEGTASRAVTRAPTEALATKELEEYVDAAEDNFEIDLNYSPGQQVTELFDSDKESSSSTHRGGVSGLYTATPRLKTGWIKG